MFQATCSRLLAATVAIAWTFSATRAAPLDDLITELPDYGRPPTPQFSGYLDASKGCDPDTNGPVCKIHYWLALADNNDGDVDTVTDTDTVTKPVPKTVLWLNGGPGSSSLLGWLQEVGPLLLNATGGLMDNPWGWTKAGVNLMAIEAPMGVGFSYCSRQLGSDKNQDKNQDTHEPKPCDNTDTNTAEASRAALVDFFSNKFPELAGGEFYIAGESYAGVYIPTLAKELLTNPDSREHVPLKGILVGDPCTDNDAQNDSMDSVWYSHKYGLMDNEIFDVLTSDEYLVHITDLTERRRAAENLYRSRVLGMEADDSIDADADADVCKLAYRKFLMSSSHALSQGWKDLYIDDYSLFAPVSSKEDDQMAAYFNRQDVREALHVTDTLSETWPMPDVGFSYTKEYNACNWKPKPFIKYPDTTMVDVYRDILPLLDRVWVYNGDTDPCVSYEGTREAVKQILADELDGGSYRPWFYRQEAASLEMLAEKSVLFGPDLVAQTLEEAQFAGEVTSYENGLSFVTFHGSGHMVPQFRPQSSLHFLKRFLHASDNGDALSPLLPSNATLSELGDDAFERAIAEWTESARNDYS
eukprot:jgi/Psemu1/187563/e_gw1.69.80.1